MRFEEFQLRASIETDTLTAWLDARWIVPREEAATPLFSEGDIARAQLIRDLIDDVGVNEDGVDVVLGLIDQIHGLRRTLGDLMQAVRAQPEPIRRQITDALLAAQRRSG